MRFLFSTLPGLGHFFPIVPLAWAARAEVFRTMQARTGAFPFAQGNFSTDMLTAVSGVFAEISDRMADRTQSLGVPRRGPVAQPERRTGGRGGTHGEHGHGDAQ